MKNIIDFELHQATLDELDNYIDVHNPKQLGNFMEILIRLSIDNDVIPEIIEYSNRRSKRYART